MFAEALGLSAPNQTNSTEEVKSAVAATSEETKGALPQKAKKSKLQVLTDDPYLAEFEGDL